MNDRFSMVQKVRFGDLDAMQLGGSAPYVSLRSPTPVECYIASTARAAHSRSRASFASE
jgi:hypothetical protein